MKALKLLGLYLMVTICLSVLIFVLTMSVVAVLLVISIQDSTVWSILNPIGNPFAVAIPIITALILLIPGIGFNWKYLDEK